MKVLIVWCCTLATATLSLFGSSFMLVTIFLFGKRRGLSRLITFLAIGDWGWSMTVCISHVILLTHPELYTKHVCIIFRIFFQFFGGSTVFWTTCISFYLYRCVFSVAHIRNTIITPNNNNGGAGVDSDRIVFGIFHIVSWGVPFVFVVVILTTHQFEQDPSVKLCFPEPWPHFYMWFLPIIISFTSSVIVYTLLMFKLKSTMTWRFIFKGFRDQTLSLPFRISLYLLVFFLCWGVDITQYTIVTFHGTGNKFGPKLYALVVFYNAVLQSQGFLDFLIYGIANKEARKNYSGRPGFAICTFIFAPVLVIPCMIAPIRNYFCNKRKSHRYQYQSITSPLPPNSLGDISNFS